MRACVCVVCACGDVWHAAMWIPIGAVQGIMYRIRVRVRVRARDSVRFRDNPDPDPRP